MAQFTKSKVVRSLTKWLSWDERPAAIIAALLGDMKPDWPNRSTMSGIECTKRSADIHSLWCAGSDC